MPPFEDEEDEDEETRLLPPAPAPSLNREREIFDFTLYNIPWKWNVAHFDPVDYGSQPCMAHVGGGGCISPFRVGMFPLDEFLRCCSVQHVFHVFQGHHRSRYHY